MAERSRDEKLYVRIAATVRDMIVAGRLQPGDKLPPLSEIAQDFGCSRATVREALSALRGQGLIEVRHGDGTYVRTAAVEMWMEPLDAAILLGQGKAKQLIELMTTLLAGIVTLGAQRNHTIDFSALGRVLFELECVERPGEEAIAAELAFYSAVADGIDNPLLANAFRVLQEAMRSSLRVFQEIDGGRNSRAGLDLCRRLYDSLAAGQDVEARDLVYRYGEKLATQLVELRLRRQYGESEG